MQTTDAEVATAEQRILAAEQRAKAAGAAAAADIPENVKPFATSLFAPAADKRLRGLTRRYAYSLSVAWRTPERKLRTAGERSTTLVLI